MRTHAEHYDPFERHVHPSGWRPALEVMPSKSAWRRIPAVVLASGLGWGIAFGAVLMAVEMVR